MSTGTSWAHRETHYWILKKGGGGFHIRIMHSGTVAQCENGTVHKKAENFSTKWMNINSSSSQLTDTEIETAQNMQGSANTSKAASCLTERTT